MSDLQSENSILEINAVQFVYVESCYKILTSKQNLNRNIDISNIYNLPFDVMCFSLEKTTTMTLFQMNRQSMIFLKQPANKIGANVMTICEGPAVKDKINKIEVVKLSMNHTYLCVS